MSASLRLSIGASEGTDAIVQVFSAFERGDRILLANGIDAEIREYDLSGKLIRRFGRRGQGPGEFVELTWIAPWRMDSLVALDRPMARVSVFDASGSYARFFRLPVALLEPVDWIAEYGAGFAVGLSHMPDPRAVNGASRDSFYVALVGPDPNADAARRLLPPIPGRWWRSPGPGRLAALRDGPYPLVAVRDGVMLASTSDSHEILRWNGKAWNSVPLAGQRWTNGYVQRDPDVLRRLHDGLVLSRGGGFWLSDTNVDTTGLRTWRRFGPDGVPQSSIRLPSDLVVWQVDEPMVLGKRTTEDGVEYLQVWELSE